jgi:hypothetical protein
MSEKSYKDTARFFFSHGLHRRNDKGGAKMVIVSTLWSHDLDGI